jgi:hypothetical protein
MRFIFILTPLFFLSSCFLLFASDPTSPTSTLTMSYKSYTGLLGNENVEGTIQNSGYSTVYDIKIRATVHLFSGKTDVSEFTVSAGVPSHSSIAFQQKIYVSDSNGKIDLCIIGGRY